MRGRVNIPPRTGGIVNGVVRQYQVAEGNNISTGDYVQLVGADSSDWNNIYNDTVPTINGQTSTQRNNVSRPFGIYKLSDGKGIFFGVDYASPYGIFYGILTLDESGDASGVSIQYLRTGSTTYTGLSICEITQDVFLVSWYQDTARETLLLKYVNGSVSLFRDIQTGHPWKLLFGAAVLKIAGQVATMVALAGAVSYSSSKYTTTTYGLITFTVNLSSGAVTEIQNLSNPGVSVNTVNYPEGFWNDGTYVFLAEASYGTIYSWSVSADGVITGSVTKTEEESAMTSRFSKIKNGVYCRLQSKSMSPTQFYESQGNSWVNQSGKVYSNVQVQIMKITSSGVTITAGGDIEFTVPEDTYPTSSSGTAYFAFTLGGGNCSYLGNNKLMVLIPLNYGLSSSYNKDTLTTALACGIVEYNPDTDTFSESNKFTWGYSLCKNATRAQFSQNYWEFHGCTLAGFVSNNRCNFIGFYGGKKTAQATTINPSILSLQAMSFAFEGREIIKPSTEVLVKKYVSKIAGIAKTSGSSGEMIEVYAPE